MARGRTIRIRQIIFRIFYSTSFTIVFLLTIAFSCAGPIDALYQSYRRGRLVDMFLIAGVYVVTGLLAIFLYASRLYTNRSILKDIPKTYMPVDKFELPGKRVWRLIEDCKSRSAVIAYQARPRARRIENEVPQARERINILLRSERSKEDQIFDPQWGKISHRGWSSPAAKETPNLAYATVIAELTDLIEARAVSLAPVQSDLPATADSDSEPEVVSDLYILAALRRPEEMGMRQYVSQLTSLGVLEENSLSVAFLALYERARFAPKPLSEDEFKSLMRMFAEILRTMRALDVTLLNIPEDIDSFPEDNAKRKGSDEGDKRAFTRYDTNASASSIAETASSTGSVQRHPSPLLSSTRNTGPPRLSEDYPRSISSSIYHDNLTDMYTDADENWAAVTTRPPFLQSATSNTLSTSYSLTNNETSRTRQLATRLSARSSRLSLARLRRRGSVESRGAAMSMKSAKSQGSVIRLVDDQEGGRDGRESRLFEFITPDEEEDERQDRGPPRDID